MVALARTVLFRRLRTVLIRAHDTGLIGTTLNFDYEVRSSKEVFDDIPDLKIEGEMLDLAKHIIDTKRGSFDAKAFQDRYESPWLNSSRRRSKVKSPPKRKSRQSHDPGDLLQALRESAGIVIFRKTKRAPAKARGAAGRAPAQRTLSQRSA